MATISLNFAPLEESFQTKVVIDGQNCEIYHSHPTGLEIVELFTRAICSGERTQALEIATRLQCCGLMLASKSFDTPDGFKRCVELAIAEDHDLYITLIKVYQQAFQRILQARHSSPKNPVLVP